MTARPASLAVATALMAIIGTGTAIVGAVLLVIATAGAGAVHPGGPIAALVALLGAAAVVASVVTFLAAAGLWLRRPWGWGGSLAVALAAVIGAVIALDTSGSQLPTMIGLVLAIVAAALLMTPSARAASSLA